jgi:hypothetical protein
MSEVKINTADGEQWSRMYAMALKREQDLLSDNGRLRGIIDDYVETTARKVAYIERLKAQRDRMREVLEELVFLIDHDAFYNDVPEPTEMIRACAELAQGGQDEK